MTARLMLLSLAASSLIAACASDEMTEPKTTFTLTVENVSAEYDIIDSGAFTTVEGASEPSPAGAGAAYSFTAHGGPGHRLSFATMFVHSNDLFYATPPGGLPLFDKAGEPLSGDVTSQIALWDAGTEVDEEPGAGPHQAPHQVAAGAGEADMNKSVRTADDSFDNLPMVSDVIKVTVTPEMGGAFKVRIENISGGSTLTTASGDMSAAPIAPGVYAVHGDFMLLFVDGMPAGDEGLEALAEDGDPSVLASSLASRTGLTSPIAPGVYAIHGDPAPLFSDGMADRGEGLEALAEDGDPSALAMAITEMGLMSGAFTTPSGADGPAPAMPGSSYSFTFEASPGERLSFATMLVQSNDLFFAPSEQGIPLFDEEGMARSGNMSAAIRLWDAGTEVNERPGSGASQAPRQGTANTGASDTMPVQVVDDSYTYPKVDEIIRVTLSIR
jgi:hypothetical protein